MHDLTITALTGKQKLVGASLALVLLAGCVSNPSQPDAAKRDNAAPQSTAGMDAQGNVTDPTKVKSGSGQRIKVGEWEGEVTGNPVTNSKFNRLKIGMSMREATDLTGPPTDQGAYVTGKAWIPFYFGGDKHRYELTYKGQGRLVFAGGGMGDFNSGHLIWIIHSAAETGYR